MRRKYRKHYKEKNGFSFATFVARCVHVMQHLREYRPLDPLYFYDFIVSCRVFVALPGYVEKGLKVFIFRPGKNSFFAKILVSIGTYKGIPGNK